MFFSCGHHVVMAASVKEFRHDMACDFLGPVAGIDGQCRFDCSDIRIGNRKYQREFGRACIPLLTEHHAHIGFARKLPPKRNKTISHGRADTSVLPGFTQPSSNATRVII